MKFMVEVRFVSVVVPTYNRKEILMECLISLFNQTYPKDKYEIIVVNDGSTDGTEEVLKEYAKKAPCIFKWFSQENKGPSAARNLGIEHAKGEIICFTDDDCIADEKWIENLVKEFTNEKVGGVGGEIVAYNPKTLVEKYGISFDQRNVSKVSLITGNCAYKKKVFEEVGLFDTKLKGLEDIDFGIRVKMKGYELNFAPDAIVFHRHYNTLRSLIKRKYKEGIQFACLSKKYTKHFNPQYASIFLLRALRTLILLPLRMSKNKSAFLRDIFSIIVLISTFLGFLRGMLLEEYPGNKITEKIDFLGDESLIAMIKRKITF